MEAGCLSVTLHFIFCTRIYSFVSIGASVPWRGVCGVWTSEDNSQTSILAFQLVDSGTELRSGLVAWAFAHRAIF